MNARPAAIARTRIRDFALYIVIALAFALVLMWGGTMSERDSTEIINKWVGLAVHTAIVFGYTIRQCRAFWSRRSYWITMFVLLCVHLLFFITVLRAISEWRLVWWAIINPFEFVALGTALLLMGYRPTNINSKSMR